MDKDKEIQLISFLDVAQNSKMAGDYKTAIDCYENFIKINPNEAVVYNITADLYQKLYGDKSLNKQIEYYQKAFNLKPTRLSIHGLAFCYEKLGDNNNAKKYYELLLQNNPTEIDYYNYGMFLIHCGDLYLGHKYITHRFNIDDINLKYPITSTNDNRWDLYTDIKDKTLLIHFEQGFGDTIMYARFVPFMKNIAKKIIFVVQDELYDLIKNSKKISDGIEIVSSNQNIENINYDYSMALLDVPYILQTKVENIPYTDSYLEISEDKVKQYKLKYLKQNNKYNIAVASNGNRNANYNNRDIDIKEFRELSKFKEINLYSLQIENVKTDFEIINLGQTFKNFSDSACAIKNMDLIISTDNVILNLSGALGVKTIGLFNKDTNYRWFKTAGENVCWYNSVKPLQAAAQNDWKPVLKQLEGYVFSSIN